MRHLIAANWKMFKTGTEAVSTINNLLLLLKDKQVDRDILICPPSTSLYQVNSSRTSLIMLGGQNFYPFDSGAFTGEISAKMLLDSGCSYVLVGHSERRHVFNESDDLINKKVVYAMSSGLKPILCIGETLEQRESGKLSDILTMQLSSAFNNCTISASDDVTIAYEPVWSIGTGKVPSSDDIVAAHLFIREFLIKRFSALGNNIRILYGGSVKPDNTGLILGLSNVNGVLVGGASLDAESFSKIILA